MSFSDNIKGLFLKPSTSGETQTESPYLNARRTWNTHTGAVVSSRQAWQIVGILSLLIALAAVGGVIHIGSQSKFIPYIVEVDKLGQAVAAGPVTSSSKAEPRIISSAVLMFIENARLVTPDVALQRKAVLSVYSHLAPNDPATIKMNEYLNGNADASPFVRAAKEMVNTEIISVLQQTPDTWQIEWKESTRDRQGTLKGKATNWRALITVYTAETTTQTTEEQLRDNPLGIYIRDFSWSRIL